MWKFHIRKENPMKKNEIKVAKQLLKIARALVENEKTAKTKTASKPNEITDGMAGILQQVDILKQYPADVNGDTEVRAFVEDKVKMLFTMRNGIAQGYSMWQDYCQAQVKDLLDNANEIVKNGGTLKDIPEKDKETLQKYLGFLANPKYLTTVQPGKINPKGENSMQREQGQGGLKEVQGIKINSNGEIEISGPPGHFNANAKILEIPKRLLRRVSGLSEMTCSFGSRILRGIMGTDHPLVQPLGKSTGNKPKDMPEWTTTWYQMSDAAAFDPELVSMVCMKLSKQPMDISKIRDLIEKLAAQLQYQIDPAVVEEFTNRHHNIEMVLEDANANVIGYIATYRPQLEMVLSEYAKMVQTVEAQGGIVSEQGDIIQLKTSSEKTAKVINAGIWDKIVSVGKSLIEKGVAIYKKFLGVDEQLKEKVDSALPELSELESSANKITQGYQNALNAIQECLNGFQQFASGAEQQ